MSLHYLRQQRPINDPLRKTVLDDLPELADIGAIAAQLTIPELSRRA